jgi:hypothetical protein
MPSPRIFPPSIWIVLALVVGGCARDEPTAGTNHGSAEAPSTGAAPAAAEPATHLFVWAGDLDRADSDFLAVLDVAPGSPRYGQVIATVPAGARGTMPHHTEHRLPASGHLFANGFMAGTTFVFDLEDPAAPRLRTSFGGLDGYTHPHSYERLPDGNVLATFQGRGPDNEDPGGLVEIDEAGRVARSASAADPDFPRAILRPYSLAIVPALDRVVTTSYDMGEDMGFRGGRRGRTRHVQVWRLSDLRLIQTIELPPGPRGYEGEQPGEPRVLADGETVLVSTFACGLYRIVGLEGEDPSAEFAHGFDGGGCAVPVVVGRYWVEPVPSANTVVSLDVTDPSGPREVSRVTLGSRSFPHWLALDPGGFRIVVADRGDGEPRIYLVKIDSETGELSIDETFRDEGSERPGVSFTRRTWPHGATGPAKPHGAVFGR